MAANLATQPAAGSRTVTALMIESNLIEGNQPLGPNRTRDQSITDACIGWDMTVEILEDLAAGVRSRRIMVASRDCP